MCRGAVQGVGFRPTVHRLATRLGLAGWVANTPAGVVIEVEGPPLKIEAFPGLLRKGLPPLAFVDHMEAEEIPATGERGFVVRATTVGRRAGALVPPDTALCADCRRELEDPADRRHHYAFTNCTACGPRFSLVDRLPYDRERTAMACFPLCPRCRVEYDDPGDRRFHAEPVCCPACGPRLWLSASTGERLAEGDAALAAARVALAEGRIIAVKGLGGFQLACRADLTPPVIRLRQRKRRPAKPFAVMVPDLAAAHRLVVLNTADEGLMMGPRSPVVLAPRRRRSPVVDEVSPGLEDLGVMLPTTPLHVELLRNSQVPALVMTSGNLSEEPICRGNREAMDRLAEIADVFLMHNRDVVRRVDDSVVRSTPAGPVIVRRARGWVPEPLPLPAAAPEPVLALGGHLQVTACLAVDAQAFCSQHVGDLDSEVARAFHREVAAGLEDFLQVRPTIIACDLHPDYPSTWLAHELAEERGGRVVEVQHHVAHAAAVLAVHDAIPGPGEVAFAVSLDGTGWGADDTAWGGEWLTLDGELRWRRLAHLEPVPLVGGERAVHEPWRVAVAALTRAGAEDRIENTPLAAQVPAELRREVIRLVGREWPLASGAGRFFEAAGALLGLTTINSYEGEAAMRLESLAATAGAAPSPWPEVELPPASDANILPTGALLAAAAARLSAGESSAAVAAGLHTTFGELVAELTARVVPDGVRRIALGGGCMVNRLLLGDLPARFERRGLTVLLPRRVPPGDGGLSFGQAVLAAVALARGKELSCENVSR